MASPSKPPDQDLSKEERHRLKKERKQQRRQQRQQRRLERRQQQEQEQEQEPDDVIHHLNMSSEERPTVKQPQLSHTNDISHPHHHNHRHDDTTSKPDHAVNPPKPDNHKRKRHRDQHDNERGPATPQLSLEPDNTLTNTTKQKKQKTKHSSSNDLDPSQQDKDKERKKRRKEKKKAQRKLERQQLEQTKDNESQAPEVMGSQPLASTTSSNDPTQSIINSVEKKKDDKSDHDHSTKHKKSKTKRDKGKQKETVELNQQDQTPPSMTVDKPIKHKKKRQRSQDDHNHDDVVVAADDDDDRSDQSTKQRKRKSSSSSSDTNSHASTSRTTLEDLVDKDKEVTTTTTTGPSSRSRGVSSDDPAMYLATKWLPLSAIQEYVKQHNITYRKGRFSAEEDQDLTKAIEAYQYQKSLDKDQMRQLIMTPKKSTTNKTLIGNSNSSSYDNDFWPMLTQTLALKYGVRPVLAVYNHVRLMYQTGRKAGTFTEQDDENLLKLIKQFGQAWTKIGLELGRVPTDCKDRYVQVLKSRQNKQLISGSWLPKEEDLLVDLVRQYGRKWTLISKIMGTRTAQQCRIKWTDNLSRRMQAAMSVAEGHEKFNEKPWRWRKRDRSNLVHAVAQQEQVKDRSDIDWSIMTDPILVRQGTANLMERFKKLLQESSLMINKPISRENWQELMSWLLKRYPEPGSYLSPKKFAKLEQTKSKQPQFKSSQFVQDSDDDDQDKGHGDGDGHDDDDDDSSDDESHRFATQFDLLDLIMTRSIRHKVEPSTHIKTKTQGAISMKKNGAGHANWGSTRDEIEEGLDIYEAGEQARGQATAAELGMSKLSSSPSASSTSSNE
ncbi:RNA polymerase I enhancer binding protein [Microbotryomycetes sp. JL221]|nr:RNA polymerase I enhancer binding protein [Microbotryomycetes sp. JL221]